MMTCESHSTAGDINSLSSDTRQMIYLAGDLLWKGIGRMCVCAEGRRCLSVQRVAVLEEGWQLWLQALTCRPEKQNTLLLFLCSWNDGVLDVTETSSWAIGLKKQGAGHSWRTNTGLPRVLTLWPRHLRPSSHQLWGMIFSGNLHCKKYPAITFKNIWSSA